MWRLCCACAVAIALTVSSHAEGRSVQDAIDTVIDEAVLPLFADYAAQTDTMVPNVAALCETPSTNNLATARLGFGDLVEDWGAVEFIRLGPLSSENRSERTLFWPDRKGRGLLQVQRAMASQSSEVTDVEMLRQQSVAVQGLLSLEFALFGTDSDTLANNTGQRCLYALAIAQNLSAIAAEVLEDWQAEDGIAAIWRSPSDSNPLFRDESEQLRALLKLIADGAEVMKVQRLDPVLNSDPFNHKRALFWRSGNSFRSLQGNATGLKALVDAARLDQVDDGNNSSMINGMGFELSNAVRTLENMQMPIEMLANDSSAMARAKYLRIVTESLHTLAASQVPSIFGLTSGFSSLDGD